MDSNAKNDNVLRVDFRSRRTETQPPRSDAADSYEDFSSTGRVDGARARPVGDLNSRRDWLLGERLGEIAGVCSRERGICVTMALAGDAPDDRWLRTLVVTIRDPHTGYRCSRLVDRITRSETGRFLHLTTSPIVGRRPTDGDLSADTTVTLSSPHGWSTRETASAILTFSVG